MPGVGLCENERTYHHEEATIMKVVEMANLFNSVYLSTKQINPTIKDTQFVTFFNTLEALSPAGKFTTNISVEGHMYPIAEYEIWDKLTQLLKPQAVYFNVNDRYGSKDLRIHEDVDPENLWTPDQFAEFQARLANAYKTVPSFRSIADYIKPLALAPNVFAVENSGVVYVSESLSAYSMPVSLTVSADLYEDDCDSVRSVQYFRRFFVEVLTKVKVNNKPKQE
jgi:hypothetical protein